MAVVVRNHGLMFRPLRGGIGIVNPEVAESGTLGLIATSDGVDRWLLSCFHVLCRATGIAAGAKEPVFQPSRGAAAPPVAWMTDAKADPALDCAAALVEPAVVCAPEVLGLGKVAPAQAPAVNMLVVKSGLSTGVTEGVIRKIEGARVEIGMRAGYPSSYDLSAGGDSGAVWVLQGTGAPVALHRGGTDSGEELAEAVDIRAVLGSLRLSVFVG